MAFLGKYRQFCVPAILIAFFLLALGLRAIPALYAPAGGFLPIYDSDTWYTLRQVEVMVHRFPQYDWFDAMTAYPTGKSIGWGPLYPALAALLSLAAGAASRTGMIATSMWLGPILGASMVPVMYLLGKAIWNRWAGLVAAGLVSFAAFRLFFLSSYGYVDHHIAEVFFTALFVLMYCWGLVSARDHPIDLSRPRSLVPVLALALAAGLIFFAGILASTTVVLLALVLGIYTVIQVTLDVLGGRSSSYLLVLHTGIFATAILAFLAFGIRAEGLTLGLYSAGHLYAYGALISETLALYLASRVTLGRRGAYLILLASLAGVACLVLLLVPPLQAMASEAAGFLTGSGPFSSGIQEMQPWSLLSAWHNFNVLPLLMAGGFVVLFLHLKAGVRQEEMFIGVWGAFLLVMTALHSRFEYYLAVPLLLLSSLFIVETLRVGLPALRAWMGEHRAGTSPREPPRARDSRSSRQRPEKKKKGRDREKPKPDRATRGRGYALLGALVIALVTVAVIISLVQAVESGMDVPSSVIHGDWLESLAWMENHTPSPGVDYFGTYDPATFSYPQGSYGVLATWDAGHWITFFSRRIPNTNPFQDNLMGADGSAAFLLTPSEDRAGAILDGLGTRYVVTDAWTATGGFTGMLPWVDPSLSTTSYYEAIFVPDTRDPGSLGLYEFYTDDYFRSMIARLHFFDGSLALPAMVRYIEYTVRQVPGPGETAPLSTIGAVATKSEARDAVLAARDAAQVNANPRGGIHATVVSDLPDRPITKVPALSRFRLVHESPSDVAWEDESDEDHPGDVKYVKVFEYVRGARIRGEGTIELPLVTDTGRAFTYRAESENGEFVVPYSTEGNPYEVRATGPYRITGSDRTFQVTEDQVLSGATVVS